MLSYQIIVVNNFEELSDSDETKVFFGNLDEKNRIFNTISSLETTENSQPSKLLQFVSEKTRKMIHIH